MKKFSIFLFTFALGLIAHGAVVVVPAPNAQAAINSAQAGDVIGLLPGSCPKLTIVNKEIIIKAQGPSPTVISGIDSNASQLTLIGLHVAELNATDAGTPSKLIVHDGKYGRITSSVSYCTISYAEANYLSLSNRAVVTGCELDGSTQHFQEVALNSDIGIDVHGNNTQAIIRNSRIWDYKEASNANITEKFIGIRLRNGSSTTIHNNLIYNCYDSNGVGTETDCGMGIFVKSPAVASIFGNALWGCYLAHGHAQVDPEIRGDRLIYSSGSAYVKHNFFWKNPFGKIHADITSPGLLTDNVIQNNSGYGVFSGLSAGNFTPQPNSGMIDAGPPESDYNDRDGTRNDIGLFGGRHYIPNAKSGTKPVVISFELPVAVPRNGTATIKSTGATVK